MLGYVRWLESVVRLRVGSLCAYLVAAPLDECVAHDLATVSEGCRELGRTTAQLQANPTHQTLARRRKEACHDGALLPRCCGVA